MAAKPHWTEARAHLAPGPRTSCFIQLLSPSQGNSFSPHSEVAQQTPTRLQGPAQMSLSLSSLPCTLWVRGQGTSLFLTLASLNCGWPFTSLSPRRPGGSRSPASLQPSPEHGTYLERFRRSLLDGGSPEGRNKPSLSLCCGPGPCLPTQGLQSRPFLP